MAAPQGNRGHLTLVESLTPADKRALYRETIPMVADAGEPGLGLVRPPLPSDEGA